MSCPGCPIVENPACVPAQRTATQASCNLVPIRLLICCQLPLWPLGWHELTKYSKLTCAANGSGFVEFSA